MRTSLLSLAAALLVAPAAVALPLSFSAGTSLTVVGGYSQAVVVSAFNITNTGAQTLSLGLERQVISEVPGSENSFCFGVGCYPPSVTVAPTPIILAAGATDNSFIGDYLPNGQSGITVVRYAIYDYNAAGLPGDTAYCTVTYDATQRVTGLVADFAASTLLGAPAPNPAAAGTDVSFAIAADAPYGSTMRLVDLRDGRAVRTLTLTGVELGWCAPITSPAPRTNGGGPRGGCGSGGAGIAPGGCYGPGTDDGTTTTATRPAPTTIRFSTAGLAAGVYGCQLVDGKGRPRAMHRLVVQ